MLAAGTEEIGGGGNWLGGRRPEAEKTGRRSRLRQPRADSFGVEVQHSGAVKMASSICSGAAGVGGDHDDSGGRR